MSDDKSIHDQIMLDFIEYFKNVEKWESTHFDVPAVRARDALRRLKRLLLARRKEIQQIRAIRRKAKRDGKQKQK
jgi:hypothetical protein